MPITINFDYEHIANNFVEIEHLGNVCLQGYSEENGYFYYLLIKTIRGNTKIYSYGPILEDKEDLLDGYTTTYQSVEYSTKYLQRFITSWLNDKNKKLNGCYVIDEETFKNNHLSIANDLVDENIEEESFVD